MLRSEYNISFPIVGLTGNGMPKDIAHFIAHGATAVLVKPIDMGAFERIMETHCKGQQ